MPYLNLDISYQEHPKTMRLISWLGEMADAIPVRLWSYCARVHPEDGFLKGYSVKEVEGVIRWRGEEKLAVKALIAVGFLKKIKDGYLCNDWLEHQGHLEAFSRRGKVAARARWNKHAKSMPEAMQNEDFEMPQPTNQPTIPNQPTKPTTKYDSLFLKFWDIYPNKKAKGAAVRAWEKLKPSEELTASMLEAIRAQTDSESWKKDGGKFIPHPATWLNQSRWEDQVGPIDFDRQRMEARMAQQPKVF